VARLLATHQRSRTNSPRQRLADDLNHLSQRERSVLELTAQGYGGVEIGEQLGISNKTVETYKERIEEKLGLRHRSEYVRFALEIGLLHR
jgi:DNA-binding NarL/FixJ family response regulator